MRIVAVMIFLVWGLQASEFDDAVASYEKGGYISALNTFYVLAKKGDPKAQYNVALIYEQAKGSNPISPKRSAGTKRQPSRATPKHSITSHVSTTAKGTRGSRTPMKKPSTGTKRR